VNGKLVTLSAAIALEWAIAIAAMKRSSEWVVGILIPQIAH
jgi:hypothetical protein